MPARLNDVGCIVTAREQATYELRVLHEWGSATEALEAITAKLDSWPGNWRVLCYSTYATIRRDLGVSYKGAKTTRRKGPRADRGVIERNALNRIGRIDRLDPELRA